MLQFSIDQPPNSVDEIPEYIAVRIEEVMETLKLLKVPQLKSLCRACKLSANFRKAELIEKLTTFFNDLFKDPNQMMDNFSCIKYLFEKLAEDSPLPVFQDLVTARYYNKSFDTVNVEQKASGSKTTTTNKNASRKTIMSPYANTIHFEESPFYKLEKLVPESAQKIYVTNGRGTCTIKFKLTKEDFISLKNDENQRLYLLCGMLNPLGTRGKEVIQFPTPNEIQMNGQVVKAKVNGIKNKKGTAKPADLTTYLTDDNKQNIFQFVYAFTVTEYLLYIYIVRVIPPEVLLEQILSQPKILRAATLYYLKQTMNEDTDDDLITTSTVMSLNCPISCMRMKHPAKSTACKHLQCFDALWFLHSQIQVPTWQCPVCQIPVKLEQLAISEFVEEILEKSDDDIEQVELSADGSWEPFVDENTQKNGSDSDTDTDEGIINKKENAISELSKSVFQGNNDHSAENRNEPIVISLDSDEDHDNDYNENTTNNDEINNQEGQSNIIGTYMDTSRIGKSLDPKISQNTPTMKRFNPDLSTNYLERTSGRLTNILGEEPLNSNNSTPLRNKNFEQRHPSILNEQIKFPQYLQSNPFITGNNVNASNEPSRTSSLSTEIMTNPRVTFNEQENNTNIDNSGIDVPDSIYEQSNYTQVNNDTSNGRKEDNIDPNIYSTSFSLSGYDSTMNLLKDSLGSSRDQSTIPDIPEIPTTSANQTRTTLPQLPDLPSLGNAAETEEIYDRSKNVGLSPESKFIRSRVSSMMKRPIIAPFQPRRNNSNSLPQKRQFSDSSTLNSSYNDGNV